MRTPVLIVFDSLSKSLTQWWFQRGSALLWASILSYSGMLVCTKHLRAPDEL